MSKWQEQKKLVLETSLKMVEKGLVTGSSGNISLRLPPEGGRELLAITPTSRHYDLLTVDDIQVVDFEAKSVEGKLAPSVETMLHIGIYRVRKDVNAIIHTHSVFASAVSVTGMEIPCIMDDQVIYIGGEIRVARYAVSGSSEMEKNVIAALARKNAVLLANHGAIGVGRTMREAFDICELVEKTARIYLLALAAGKVNLVPEEGIEWGRAFFNMT